MRTTKSEYTEKLKDPRWQKLRLKIFERDKFTCQRCGTEKKTLHVHHLVYRPGKEPWESPSDDLLTLCDKCHKIASNKDAQQEAMRFVALVGGIGTSCQEAMVSIMYSSLMVGLQEQCSTEDVLMNALDVERDYEELRKLSKEVEYSGGGVK